MGSQAQFVRMHVVQATAAVLGVVLIVLLFAALAPSAAHAQIGFDPTFCDANPEACLNPRADADGDEILNRDDNCPLVVNADQADAERDGRGDVCDPDDDNDGDLDGADNCPTDANPNQENSDTQGDGGDACDLDDDDDGKPDITFRMCGSNAFESQCLDNQATCTPGTTNGGFGGPVTITCERRLGDNCRTVPNSGQQDTDGDKRGDACDPDDQPNADPDGDGVANATDNCPVNSNSTQGDSDGDGFGNICDWNDEDGPDGDEDDDTVANRTDNCTKVANSNQADSNGDGVGDACDSDSDGDPNHLDNCPNDANPNQNDVDNDKAGDACDPDDDGDFLPDLDTYRKCVTNSFNPLGAVCTVESSCTPGTTGGGSNLGVPSATITTTCQFMPADNCRAVANPQQQDLDNDGTGDACDGDLDGDGTTNENDWAPRDGGESKDTDTDGAGDNADTDDDNDGRLDTADNCRLEPNPDQANADGDSQGNRCDSDDDNDGVPDTADNCPVDANASQTDVDGDGKGTACDTNGESTGGTGGSTGGTSNNSGTGSGGGETGTPDTSPPSWTFKAVTGQRAVKAKAVVFTITPNEPCKVVAAAKLGRTALGKLTRSLSAKTVAKLKLSSRGLGALRKALRSKRTLTLSLVIVCTDGAGNKAASTKKVKVKA